MLETQERHRQANSKRLCYLSMEFFIGRSLENNLSNLGLLDVARKALKGLGADLEELTDSESDAADHCEATSVPRGRSLWSVISGRQKKRTGTRQEPVPVEV